MATSIFDSLEQQPEASGTIPEVHQDLFAKSMQQAGAQTEQNSDQIEAGQRVDKGATDPSAVGAKVLQSATFGFGADVAGMFDKEAGKEIRSLEDYYNKNHPLAAAGIDLATGMAQSMVIPGSGAAGVARGAGRVLARNAGLGAASGALTGLGSGGSMGTRLQRAGEGAITGGVASGAMSGVANVAGRVVDRTKLASQSRQAAEKLQTALAKDGITPQQFAQMVQQNPNLRLVDVSPSAAAVVSKAAKTSEKASIQAQDAARLDIAAQTDRMATELQPLMPLKQKLVDNLQKMEANKNELYKQSNIEIVPLTRELNDVLHDPTVKPFLAGVSDTVNKAHKAGTLEGLPKYRQGKEIPTVALNELQKKLGIAAENAVGQRGSIEAKTLWTLQDKINHLAGSTTLSAAQAQTAQAGAASRAQQWGAQFSKGLDAAKIEDFQKFSPEAQEYARIGLLGGLEDYLVNNSRIPQGSLEKIADGIQSKEFVSVLGKNTADAVAQIYRKEASRLRTSGRMVGSPDEKDVVASVAGHTASLAGKYHVGSAMRLLHSIGMSEEQATNAIKLATSPNGFAKLEEAGVSKTMLDKLRVALDTKGVAPGKIAATAHIAQQERGRENTRPGYRVNISHGAQRKGP